MIDDPKSTGVVKRKQIAAMEKTLINKQTPLVAPQIWPAVWDMVERHHLPSRELVTVLNGVASDIVFRQPQTMAELDRYSYMVAGVVGVLSARILGATSPSALAAAKNLGIAMQYTNIIRDVSTDAAMKRVYIPAFVMHKCRVTNEMLAAPHTSKELRAAILILAGRAEKYYQLARPGIAAIPRSQRRPVIVAYHLYRGILESIKQKRYNVNAKRVRVSAFKKAKVVWQVYTSDNL
jgi:phytoene synthase